MMKAFCITSAIALYISLPAKSDVHSTFSFSEWQELVDGFMTIPFTGYSNETAIGTQYADLGITFTGPSFISGPTPLFPNDSWGLRGPTGLHLFFDEPQSWIGIHHAGNAYFDLFSDGELIGTSNFDPVGGIGSFLGIHSTVAFDEVIITKPAVLGTNISIDDLHWGSAIPSPGAVALLGMGAMTLPRRRRR
jgi:hypothetical protein